MSTNPKPIISAHRLTRHFPVCKGLLGREVGRVHAVDEVSFSVQPGQTVALVGESGCGKTTTGRLLLRLLRPTSGEIHFEGQPIHNLDESELRPLRKQMQIIFQDPYSSLNPRMTVGAIVEEGLRIHTDLAPTDRRDRVVELLRTVELSASSLERYPHEFSGGQRQRVGIARALSVDPSFIVCDEAVSALDVSIQAQIINLLARLQAEMGIAYLFIAHDLAVVRCIAHSVIVMHLGHIMEEAPTDILFDDPLHPYTRCLLSAVPSPRPGVRKERILLRGEVPNPIDPPSGCRFRTRCPWAVERCAVEPVPTITTEDGRRVRCILYADGARPDLSINKLSTVADSEGEDT